MKTTGLKIYFKIVIVSELATSSKALPLVDAIIAITISNIIETPAVTIIKKKNNIIYIKALDPNNHNIYFKFNLDTKVLTVTKSSWLYLNKGDTFSFNL